MTPFHPVEIHDVSQEMFDELIEQLGDYDLKVTSQGGRYSVSGRGVQGTIEYRAKQKALQLELDAHHDLVTTGYVIGFIYDRLVAGVPADSKA
ncbi:MAG: hypothetical protein ABSH49_15585 [Bryobacteraceae bacterium]|jgi:hypothetical protein